MSRKEPYTCQQKRLIADFIFGDTNAGKSTRMSPNMIAQRIYLITVVRDLNRYNKCQWRVVAHPDWILVHVTDDVNEVEQDIIAHIARKVGEDTDRSWRDNLPQRVVSFALAHNLLYPDAVPYMRFFHTMVTAIEATRKDLT